MDMGAIGLFVLGWLAVAVVVSVLLGVFLQRAHATTSEHDVEIMAERQRVIRYMRKPRTKSSCAATALVAIDDDRQPVAQLDRKQG